MQNVIFRRTILIGVLVLAAGVGINRWFASMKKAPDRNTTGAGIPTVKVAVVKNDTINANIWLSGRLRAIQKIEVFTEVTGKLASGGKPFKDGTTFNQGETILKLNDTDFRMSLNAARSNFQSTLTTALADIKIDYPDAFSAWNQLAERIDPTQELPALPEVKNEKLKSYLSAVKVYNQYYSIKAQEAQLAKYQIVAPFSGVLANANLNPNTVVRANQNLGTFLNPNHYELEAGISLDHAAKIKAGQTVTLTSSDIDGQWTGRIIRVGKSVDATTQTVKVYIAVSGNTLFEGMYLSGNVSGNSLQQALTIPRHLLVESNFVYTVNKDKLQKTKIQLLHQNRDEAVVAGLSNGAVITQQIIPGATDGMKVKAVK